MVLDHRGMAAVLFAGGLRPTAHLRDLASDVRAGLRIGAGEERRVLDAVIRSGVSLPRSDIPPADSYTVGGSFVVIVRCRSVV